MKRLGTDEPATPKKATFTRTPRKKATSTPKKEEQSEEDSENIEA